MIFHHRITIITVSFQYFYDGNTNSTSATNGVSLTAATNGISLTAASNNANPGSASFMCNNGTWGAPFAVSCSTPYTPPPIVGGPTGGLNPLPITPAPAPSACGYTPISESWLPGCSGTAPAGSVAINGTVTVNNTATGYSGAVTYRCETSGGGSPSLVRKTATCNPGATCSYTAWGKVVGDTIEWASGSNTCSGPLPAPPAPGGSMTVTDNTMNGTTDLSTGTYRANCRADGTWDPTAVVTCNEPPASKCNPRAVSWPGADGSQCSGFTTLTPYGQTVTVFSDNGSTGATDITCNPGTGTWGAPFNSNCEKPVQPCPGGGTMAWGNCYGPGPATAMADGAQYTAQNTAQGYTGQSNNVCENGVWKQLGATCDTDATYTGCEGTTIGWQNGDTGYPDLTLATPDWPNQCVGAASYKVANPGMCNGYYCLAPIGFSMFVTDSTNPRTGSLSVICTDPGAGNSPRWVIQGAATCTP